MRRILQVLLVLLAVPLLGVGGLVAYAALRTEPDYTQVPEPNVVVDGTAEQIARGEYLVHVVGHCSACHGDETPASGPAHHPAPSNVNGGFAMEAGPFGRYYPANLTPDDTTGLGAVSDGAIARALRTGVTREGTLSLTMATSVGAMADEDLAAIVAYLRSLPPVGKRVPRSEPSILSKVFGLFVAPHDEPAPPWVPPGETSVARGEYLANGPAACYLCHTDVSLPDLRPSGPRFSGLAMAEPDPTDGAYEIVAPNLTPDPETGVLAGWTEEQFVARFRHGRVHAGSKMPWESFSRMTDADLRSLWRYLQTLPPTRKLVGPSRRLAGWSPDQGS